MGVAGDNLCPKKTNSASHLSLENVGRTVGMDSFHFFQSFLQNYIQLRLWGLGG